MNIIIYYGFILLILYFIINYYFNKNKELIIDVRTEDEWKQYHHPGAINIPYKKIDNLDIDKETDIILYCNSGRRAKIARDSLTKLGYKNVKVNNLLSSTTNFRPITD